MNLQHLTILVTGGSRGVGAAIAKSCAEYGAKVIVHYNGNKTAADAVCDSLGANALGTIKEDLSKIGGGARLWGAAFKMAHETGRTLNALVNNAGIDMLSDPAGSTVDWDVSWQKIMQVNMQAPADLSRAALNSFALGRDTAVRGRIVNVCSRASHRGDSLDHCAYAASKGGLLSFSKTLARGAAKDGVLVYALAPGWINTEMAPTDPAVLGPAIAEIPLGKLAEPSEIGAMTAFLLSDLCPSATAATIDINGASHVR